MIGAAPARTGAPAPVRAACGEARGWPEAHVEADDRGARFQHAFGGGTHRGATGSLRCAVELAGRGLARPVERPAGGPDIWCHVRHSRISADCRTDAVRHAVPHSGARWWLSADRTPRRRRALRCEL